MLALDPHGASPGLWQLGTSEISESHHLALGFIDLYPWAGEKKKRGGRLVLRCIEGLDNRMELTIARC